MQQRINQGKSENALAQIPPSDYEQLKKIKKKAIQLMIKNNPDAVETDSDFVFIHFILHYMPIGMVGLLFAVILSAGMSSISSELNALSATLIVDFYKRSWQKERSEKHYLNASKICTGLWGVVAIGFAMIFSLSDNLIEVVNIIGSLFYGVILGIFITGFFVKNVQSKPLLLSALIAEVIVMGTFVCERLGLVDFSYLWLNPLGCLLVVFLGILFQWMLKLARK